MIVTLIVIMILIVILALIVILSMIGYEIEYFSFLIIAVLFSAGNAKKNVFTVFINPIVTIDGFLQL